MKGQRPATLEEPIDPREVRKHAALTQVQMATLMGMSLSEYRKWEQGQPHVSSPAAMLPRVIEKEPNAEQRALGRK